MNEAIRRQNAHTEFQHARRDAELERWRKAIGNRALNPLSFEEVRIALQLKTPLYRGIQDVPIDLIVGSVGRNSDFTRRFLPLDDSLQERWIAVRALADQSGWLPIELYQVGEVFFVRDGNHRVSVAREIGMATIEAKVWGYPKNIKINPDDLLDDILLRHEAEQFFEQTKLDPTALPQDIRLTLPSRYRALLVQIETLQTDLSALDDVAMPLPEAATAWYDLMFLPVAQVIAEQELLAQFPMRTVADLFVWLSIHQEELGERYGAGNSLPDLARRLGQEFGEGLFGRMGRRLRNWLGQGMLSPAEQLDQTLLTMAEEAQRRKEQWRRVVPALHRSDETMLIKNYSKTGAICRVTFKLPAEVDAQTANLVGEFNNWDETAHPMKRLKDNSFSLTISLPANQAYRFRYQLDGERWENDWSADAYVPNVHGSEDSIIQL